MQTALFLLLTLTFQHIVVNNGTTVQAPVLIIKGHYMDSDGRVSEHKFPVEINLTADGKFTGSYETWLEKIYVDCSKLAYYNKTFSGRWKIENNTFLLTPDNGYALPNFIFGNINGLRIKIVENKPLKKM